MWEAQQQMINYEVRVKVRFRVSRYVRGATADEQLCGGGGLMVSLNWSLSLSWSLSRSRSLSMSLSLKPEEGGA